MNFVLFLMRLLIGLLFLIPVSAPAQNLLMNESFEDENICTEYIKNCAPEGWISTSLLGDYYFDDPRNAYDGQHFVGLMFATGGHKKVSIQKYIRSRLLCSLRPGAMYKLQFYIRSFHSGLDSIGIYFSNDDILFRKAGIVKDQPQLWVKDGIASDFSIEWQKVSFIYTATGKENFISIGDFQTSGRDFSGMPDLGNKFYFFIDKVSLVPVNISESSCEDSEKIREEEYEFDPRHKILDRYIYTYRKTPPPLTPTSVTVVKRIDTLVLPDVLFATNSYALNKITHGTLDSFIRSNSHYKVDSLVVEGHTDSKGSSTLNNKLSLNRAISVGEYLQPHFLQVIKIRGWASIKPVADNRTPEGRQKNRRVEIYLYTRE